MEFLSKVRMGHTEFGSLVINLISPVAPSLDKSAMLFSEDMFDEAFERRVTRKLASGLFASRQAVDKVNRSNADIGEFESRIRDEISSNLCQYIASLVQAGRGLKIDISWAITRPVDPDCMKRSTIPFGTRDVPVLREAARILSDRQERIDEEIYGYVSRLKRNKGDPIGTVTIKAFVEGKVASVQAEFNEEDYSKITRAHEDRMSVSLEGDLYRKGQRWFIRNPRRISVLEDDE